MFFKLCAGFLSSLAIVTGVAFAIPDSREFILNTVAPYSEVYEQQQDKTNELENAYTENLETLDITYEALQNAEQQLASFQNQLTATQTELSTATTNLNTINDELNTVQTNFDNATVVINQLNADISSLNAQYTQLQDDYNQALTNGDQQIIDALTIQIESLQLQLDSLYMQIDDVWMQRNDLEMQLYDYQMQVDMLYNDIMMRDSEMMELQEQLNNQQTIIDQLNEQIASSVITTKYFDECTIEYRRSFVGLVYSVFGTNNTPLYQIVDYGTAGIEQFESGANIPNKLMYYKNIVESTNATIELNKGITLHLYDQYCIIFGNNGFDIKNPATMYLYADGAVVNEKYFYDNIEMTESDFLNNIESSADYKMLIEFVYTLDNNSLVSSVTCNYKVANYNL